LQPLSEEEISNYIKAGRAIREAKRRVQSFVKEGMRILDICELVEKLLEEQRCRPAFPCGVCINVVAAHYTAGIDDQKVIPPESLVKVDMGAHVEGCIADSAITISINSEHVDMITAAEEALEKAVEVIEPGMKIYEVSSVIEKTIKSYGFKPISNLTGHKLEPYTVHAGVTIPNVASLESRMARFEPGGVYAIEPFVTTREGAGEVINGAGGNILRVARVKAPKDPKLREFFNDVRTTFKTLPFTARWLVDKWGKEFTKAAVEELLRGRLLYEYPVLIERLKKPVAQAEHTVLVLEKEVIVIT